MGIGQAAARTLKWNTVDRVSSIVLVSAVGIVLANILSQEDFGIVGILGVFQSFAILFVDSGFGTALLQRRTTTREDYSTVFWFNLGVSVAVYALLWFCAPLIARMFHDNGELIPLSRLMFLTFILSGLGIVQTNRMMKRMDVRQIAISNMVAVILSGTLGIWLALSGRGPWALVWMSVAQAGVKTVWLWCVSRWYPSFCFSRESFGHVWRIGISVFSSSFLNTLTLNIYTFIIGIFFPLRAVGVYNQASKWTVMGSASLSQILTSSFLPVLSSVQDNPVRFKDYMVRLNRFAAMMVLPVLIGMAAVAGPLFHTLFSTKWDAAIPLFQILAVRGVFVVLISLYGNFLVSLGYGKSLFIMETFKDLSIVAAILATIFFKDVTLLVAGQLAASLLSYGFCLFLVDTRTGMSWLTLVRGLAPFLFSALIMTATAFFTGCLVASPFLSLLVSVIAGAAAYLLSLILLRVPELGEAKMMLRKRRNN